MKFELQFTNDIERLAVEVLIATCLLLLGCIFGDFVIKIFNGSHPISWGKYQLLPILPCAYIIWRSFRSLLYYSE